MVPSSQEILTIYLRNKWQAFFLFFLLPSFLPFLFNFGYIRSAKRNNNGQNKAKSFLICWGLSLSPIDLFSLHLSLLLKGTNTPSLLDKKGNLQYWKSHNIWWEKNFLGQGKKWINHLWVRDLGNLKVEMLEKHIANKVKIDFMSIGWRLNDFLINSYSPV